MRKSILTVYTILVVELVLILLINVLDKILGYIEDLSSVLVDIDVSTCTIKK